MQGWYLTAGDAGPAPGEAWGGKLHFPQLLSFFNSLLSDIYSTLSGLFPYLCPIYISLCLVYYLVYNSTQIVQCMSAAVQIWIKRVTTAVHQQGCGSKNASKKGRPASEKGYISLLWCRRPRAHASRIKSLCISDVNRPVTHCCLHRTLYHKA